MSAHRHYAQYIAELLSGLGSIQVKRMFGGYGVYCEGLMLGLIADDTLYLKVDAGNREMFEREDLPAFTYTSKGKKVSLSYRRAPDETLESPARMLPWARSALAAALRAQVAKTQNKKPNKRAG